MNYLPTIWTFVVGIITIAGLIIAFARVSPNDAKSNLGRWVQASGIPKLAGSLKALDVQAFLAKVGALLTLAGALGLGSFVAPYISKWISPPVDMEAKLMSVLEKRDARVRAEAIETLQKTLPQRSGLLKLNDAERWKFATTLNQQTVNLGNGKPCEARLFVKTGDASSVGLAQELPPIMQLGSWRIDGGRNQKIIFPDGVSVSVAGESGAAFNCGYRLSEVLESMGIKPVNFRANVTTPDLVDCKDCVEVLLGTTTPPQPSSR